MPDTAAEVAAFFAGHDDSRRIFDALAAAVTALGEVDIRVTKSQVAFVRDTTVARVWRPDQYLGEGHAPLVLTLGFRQRDPSPRWKQVVEPAPGRFTHHLELWSVADVDEELRGWLQAAWDGAGH